MSDPRTHLLDADIGSWVRRVRPTGSALTRSHYVQSVIAGGAITYCGLRLTPSPFAPFEVMDVPKGKCGNCPDVPAAASAVPTVDQIYGIDPDFTGDQTTAEYLAELRGYGPRDVPAGAGEDDGSTVAEMVP